MWKRWWGRPAGTSYTISSTNSIWAHYWDNVFSISIVTVFYINTQCPFDLRLFLRAWPHTSQDFFETSRQAGHIWPQHRELYALRFANSVWGLLRAVDIEGLWDGAYGLLSLSEKTGESNHLQMSLQRQRFLLSYFKNVGDGLTWSFELTTSRTVARCSITWANWLTDGLR